MTYRCDIETWPQFQQCVAYNRMDSLLTHCEVSIRSAILCGNMWIFGGSYGEL